jgi:hypothetical protein
MVAHAIGRGGQEGGAGAARMLAKLGGPRGEALVVLAEPTVRRRDDATQGRVPASSQQARGWQRFFLYREGMPQDEDVPVAVSPSAIDALEDLLPSSTWVVGLWGTIWRRIESDDPRGKIRPEFEEGADDVLMALDAEGSCYALSICSDGAPLLAGRALASIPVVHMRMVREAWRELREAQDSVSRREVGYPEAT